MPKSRFTYRSLDAGPRNLKEQSVWSATPGTDELGYLQAVRDSLAAADPAALVTPALVEEATRYVRIEYPEVRTVRFEFDPHQARIDEDLRVVYVDVSGRLWLTGADGVEFTTEEYDYFAAQTAMSLIETHTSRKLGSNLPRKQ